MTQEYKVLVGGKWCEATSGERMEVINPANGRPFASVPKCGPEDVDRAVEAALEAHPAWAGRPMSERSKVLLKLSQLGEQLGKLSVQRLIVREEFDCRLQ